MATSKSDLKLYFETGDTPTQGQFAELIDASEPINGRCFAQATDDLDAVFSTASNAARLEVSKTSGNILVGFPGLSKTFQFFAHNGTISLELIPGQVYYTEISALRGLPDGADLPVYAALDTSYIILDDPNVVSLLYVPEGIGADGNPARLQGPIGDAMSGFYVAGQFPTASAQDVEDATRVAMERGYGGITLHSKNPALPSAKVEVEDLGGGVLKTFVKTAGGINITLNMRSLPGFEGVTYTSQLSSTATVTMNFRNDQDSVYYVLKSGIIAGNGSTVSVYVSDASSIPHPAEDVVILARSGTGLGLVGQHGPLIDFIAQYLVFPKTPHHTALFSAEDGATVSQTMQGGYLTITITGNAYMYLPGIKNRLRLPNTIQFAENTLLFVDMVTAGLAPEDTQIGLGTDVIPVGQAGQMYTRATRAMVAVRGNGTTLKTCSGVLVDFLIRLIP